MGICFSLSVREEIDATGKHEIEKENPSLGGIQHEVAEECSAFEESGT